jgi:hypothetical protein
VFLEVAEAETGALFAFVLVEDDEEAADVLIVGVL